MRVSSNASRSIAAAQLMALLSVAAVLGQVSPQGQAVAKDETRKKAENLDSELSGLGMHAHMVQPAAPKILPSASGSSRHFSRPRCCTHGRGVSHNGRVAEGLGLHANSEVEPSVEPAFSTESSLADQSHEAEAAITKLASMVLLPASKRQVHRVNRMAAPSDATSPLAIQLPHQGSQARICLTVLVQACKLASLHCFGANP